MQVIPGKLSPRNLCDFLVNTSQLLNKPADEAKRIFTISGNSCDANEARQRFQQAAAIVPSAQKMAAKAQMKPSHVPVEGFLRLTLVSFSLKAGQAVALAVLISEKSNKIKEPL